MRNHEGSFHGRFRNVSTYPAKAFAQEQSKQDATPANLHSLDLQMRTLTTTQEQIKAEISGDLWNRQMLWNQKRDFYVELLRRFHEFDRDCSTVQSMIAINKTATAADAAMKSHMETKQASMKGGMELQQSVINHYKR